MKESFHPHIPAKRKVQELTLRAIALGVLFGLIFAIANAYLALKIGQTVSASIPAALMSMGLMRVFFTNVSILEHNAVQTIATIGETLAAGVAFTIPALFFLGEHPSIGRIFLLSSLGGILGILFMIPMRRFIIVEEHGKLPFPEGVACAEILKAGEKNKTIAITALWGALASAGYKICTNVLFLWKEAPSWTFSFFHKTAFIIDTTPALLGVGYIIGPRIARMMFAGGITAWWVIIPLIKIFGLGTSLIYPSNISVSEMSAQAVWSSYVRYIGAGALAIGGLFSLFRIAPLLCKTVHVTLRELFTGKAVRARGNRMDQDIPMVWLGLGSMAIILTLWLFPGMPMNFLTIVLLTVLSFFFVAVTSFTVGLVGSTSNPVSGMVITTMLLTCIIFVMLGWTEKLYLISAITMGCVSCVAISLAGTTSQDLKTGFILGATPKSQQIAELIGIFIPSLALGYTLYILDAAYQIGSPDMPAPQATLMAIIAEGVIGGTLPYTLVGIGVFIGISLSLLRIPILPFALGLYLPLSITAATVIGSLAREYVNRKCSLEIAQERGTLLASGLIAGDALIGILIALLTIAGIVPLEAEGILPDAFSLLFFLLLGAAFTFFISYRRK